MANETVVQFGASLVGRLVRTDLSASHGLQPVYEALSNSLHSIEDGKLLQGGRISIRVFRDDTQTRLKDEAGHLICRPIRDVHIEDNGIGFTEPNFVSFCTADSLQKHARGGKGIERLLHDLIFPMGTTSDEVPPDRWNLWVIDERLSFHDHLASDKKIKHQFFFV